MHEHVKVRGTAPREAGDYLVLRKQGPTGNRSGGLEDI
jgi:hypothetical protein